MPTVPEPGEKLVIEGEGWTVNDCKEMIEPLGPVMVNRPWVAPALTVTWMTPGLTTVKGTVQEPRVTLVTPVKLAPWMVTTVPTMPAKGLKPLITGWPTWVTWKSVVVVSDPEAVDKAMRPVEAPMGTKMTTLVAVTLVKEQGCPFNDAEIRLLKPTPWRVMAVPTGPALGEKDWMVGPLKLTMKS